MFQKSWCNPGGRKKWKGVRKNLGSSATIASVSKITGAETGAFHEQNYISHYEERSWKYNLPVPIVWLKVIVGLFDWLLYTLVNS